MINELFKIYLLMILILTASFIFIGILFYLIDLIGFIE